MQFEVEQLQQQQENSSGGGLPLALPQVLVLTPENKVMKAHIEKTGSNSIKVSYVPFQKGVHVVQVTPSHSEMLEYPVSICDPQSIKIVRGYDTKTRKFSPGLRPLDDNVLTFFIGEAGPGKLEAELLTPAGDKMKTDVFSQKEK